MILTRKTSTWMQIGPKEAKVLPETQKPDVSNTLPEAPILKRESCVESKAQKTEIHKDHCGKQRNRGNGNLKKKIQHRKGIV